MKKLLLTTLVIFGLANTAVAYAQPVTDPSGDFLASYTGSHNAAFDILSTDISFNPDTNQFFIQATAAGDIAGVNNAAYVFGLDVGGATNAPFTSQGFPGVIFNSTVILRANGASTVGANIIDAHIVGNEIFATVDAALLPSKGLAPQNYTWSLWSIDSSVAGLARNADFAPNANIGVTAVPEPSSAAMLVTGLGLIAVIARRRKKVQVSLFSKKHDLIGC